MKKRFLSLLLALTMVFSLLVFPASAADVPTSGSCGENVTWTLDKSGVLTISGEGKMTDYINVTAHPWHDVCDSITSVVVEDGVTSIGQSAFSGSSNLMSVTIPDSVTSIAARAFENCSSLTEVTIPDGVASIKGYTFSGCSGLKSVIIPGSITSIGDWAFTRCSNLGSVVIPDSVTDIKEGAFASCSSLTDVTIPDSITSIQDNTFIDCSSLTSIHIPDSVTSIGLAALANCSSLTEVTIPDSVTSIGRFAFQGCGLTSVTIPAGVTGIATAAFSGCSSLESVVIPDSVTSVGNEVFSRCTSLTDVYYGGTEAQWNAIAIGTDNDWLTSATIHYTEPQPVIPTSGACGENVTWALDDGVLTISGEGEMWNFLPFDLDDPEGGGMAYVEGLEAAFPEGAALAPWYSQRNSITTVVIEPGVTTIGNWAFYEYPNLTVIHIPVSVTYIGYYPFWAEGNDYGHLTDIYYGGTYGQWEQIEVARLESVEPSVISEPVIHAQPDDPTPEPTAYPTPEPTTSPPPAPTPEPPSYPIPEWTPAPLEPLGDHASVSNTRENVAWLLWRIAGAPKYTSSSCPFPDMPDDYEHYAAVMWAYENGIMNAYPDGSFLPEGKITRAEAANVLYHFENGNTPLNGNVSSTFEDVSDHDWACPVIMWFASDPDHRGDYTDTHFYPTAYFDTFSYDFDAQKYTLSLPNTEPLYPPLEGLTSVGSTRAELAWLLWRINGAPNYAYESVPFADVSRDADYYSAVAWAYHNGVMVGTSATTFDPDTHVTRAQYAVVLYRLNGMPAVVNPIHVFEDVEKGSWYYDGVCWFADQKDFGEYSDNYFCPFDVPDSISYDPQTGAWIIPMPNPFVYRISGGMAIIDGYKEFIVDSTDVVIPETLGGFPVGSISSTAFTNHHLTSVSIPVTVTKIDSGAFSGCSSLTDVYYAGNRDQWAEVVIGSDNEPLTNAAIHFGANAPGRIVTEPANTAALSGGTAVFTVETAGDVVSCQWQVSENGTDWTDLPDAVAATLELTAADSMNGNRYRCVITDKDNNTVTSESATLTIAKPVVITGDPLDSIGKAGGVAAFAVEAEGEGLTYQWQFSDNGGARWITSTISSEIYTTKLLANRNGRMIRCIVTDCFGNSATSDIARMLIRQPMKITRQLEDYYGPLNSTASFRMEAEGTGLTYQWQYSDNGGKRWTTSSVSGPEYSARLTSIKDGRLVRCIISDAVGNSIISEAASMRIAAFGITQQPQDFVGKVNSSVTFTVAARGEGLTYQWQFSDNGGTKWTTSSVSSAVYVTKLNANRNGRLVRCIVRDSNGNEAISDSAVMRIAQP